MKAIAFELEIGIYLYVLSPLKEVQFSVLTTSMTKILLNNNIVIPIYYIIEYTKHLNYR